ncbi:hypothetical protein ACFLY7_02510 [Patescibacteria group bacterium]
MTQKPITTLKELLKQLGKDKSPLKAIIETLVSGKFELGELPPPNKDDEFISKLTATEKAILTVSKMITDNLKTPQQGLSEKECFKKILQQLCLDQLIWTSIKNRISNASNQDLKICKNGNVFSYHEPYDCIYCS